MRMNRRTVFKMLGAGAAGTAVSGGVQFDTAANARASVELIDAQITQISTARAERRARK